MSSIELSPIRPIEHVDSIDVADSPRLNHERRFSFDSSSSAVDYSKDQNVTAAPSFVSSVPRETESEEPFLTAEPQPIEIDHAPWYRGWGTIALMVGCFIFALLVAICQYVLYRWLDGKAAASINETTGTTFCFLDNNCTTGAFTSQQYITTASVCLSNAFEFALQMGLAVAFTQVLWRILRTAALRIETIEAMFMLKGNVLYFFSRSVLQHAWVLALIAILIYSIPLASSFPPGALTVKSVYPRIPGFANIPTFNASDFGNGTIADLQDVAFSALVPETAEISKDGSTWDATIVTIFAGTPGPLQWLAVETIMEGNPLPIPSPCGPNCTYTYEIEGPSFNCSQEETTFTTKGLEIASISSAGKIQAIYSASWAYFDSTNEEGLLPSGAALLNVSVVNIPQIEYPSADLSAGNATILLTETKLVCVPYRSLYTIVNSYENDNQTLTYTFNEIEPLPQVQFQTANINGTVVGNGRDTGELGGIQWTNQTLSWFRDTQLIGIVNGIATALNGTVTSVPLRPSSGTSVSNVSTTPLHWSSKVLQTTGMGGSIVPFTRLSNNFRNYNFPVSTNPDPPVNFTVTEEALNKVLGDYFISLAPAFHAWNQNVSVVRFPSHNVYWFSSPNQCLIPYGICLFFGLIIIVLGIQALHINGVPATDGGFVQVMSTTTGSRRLAKAAAANCLGGDGSKLPERFKKMKIKYGELVDMQVEVGGHVVRRAGFGIEDEVIPLRKGEKYGVVGDT